MDRAAIAVEEMQQLVVDAEELAAAAAKKLKAALAAEQQSQTTPPTVEAAEVEANAAVCLATSADRLAASAEQLRAVAAMTKRSKNRSMAAAKKAATPEKDNCAKKAAVACILFIMIFFALLIAGAIMGICYVFPPGPYEPDGPLSYSAAIDSVSGLDPTMDRGLSSLDLSYLDKSKTSNSERREYPQKKKKPYHPRRRRNACVEPGMYMEVAYRRVILATSPAIQQQLCVGPHEATEQRLVARGAGVRVAGAVLDSLVEGMRQDVVVFQVTIRRSEKYDDNVVVKSCGDRQVGAAVVDLETMCKTPYPTQKYYRDSD